MEITTAGSTEMRNVTCTGCGRPGWWLSNREDDLPEGHEHELPLCGGDAPGLRSDRPYCDDCVEAAERPIAMSLWDAYRLANRRRASVQVDLAADANIGTGRSERVLRVSPHLVNGHVAVQQGTTADWHFVPAHMARDATVTR